MNKIVTLVDFLMSYTLFWAPKYVMNIFFFLEFCYAH